NNIHTSNFSQSGYHDDSASSSSSSSTRGDSWPCSTSSSFQAPPLHPSSGLICSERPTLAAGATCRDAGQGHKESFRSAHDAAAAPHSRYVWLNFLMHGVYTAIKFRSVFNEFPFFNYVQSKALDDVLYTNKNFVACAPTGSGKTVLFELAIIRLLMETQEPWSDVKAVYMAPIKALCSQCFESWKKKFGPFGLVCKELTGDTEIDDFFEIHDSHIILTTPEKWDSMTRRWKNNCLLQLVRLFLIDEVHVVKDATRGATLEVVVSRMKALHAYRTSQNPEAGLSVRFLAVSATIPNISDVSHNSDTVYNKRLISTESFNVIF
uniref:Helicase ATP-binding domain-containing protein n=1 Tax=Salarias fasciatus TaxID=181472 RepID=A0A672J8M5_SALFA